HRRQGHRQRPRRQPVAGGRSGKPVHVGILGAERSGTDGPSDRLVRGGPTAGGAAAGRRRVFEHPTEGGGPAIRSPEDRPMSDARSDVMNETVSGFRSLRYRNAFTASAKLRRFAWELVWLLAFRPTPRWALHGWRRQLLRWFGAEVGAGCRIAPSC